MDYLGLIPPLVLILCFSVSSIMAVLGKFELTKNSMWERVCLALLCVSVALGGVSDFAEVLSNILGGK